MTTKICSRCGIEKELDQFHKQPTGKFGRHCYCRDCYNAINHKRQVNISTDQKRKWNYMTRYGLSEKEVGELLDKQCGKCAICGAEPKRVCVDHDHSTGKVRGILCHRCNILIGGWDDSEWKKKALEYLNANSH